MQTEFKPRCLRCEQQEVVKNFYCQTCWDWITRRAWNNLIESLEREVTLTP